MRKIKLIFIIIVLCFVSACGGEERTNSSSTVDMDFVATIVAATLEAIPSPPTLPPVPTMQKTAYEFRARQFDPASTFFSNVPYPDELTSIPDTNIIQLGCSHVYYYAPLDGQGTRDYVYIGEGPNTKPEKMSDHLMQAFLANARTLAQSQSTDSRTKNINYISYCDIENEDAIVIYGVVPCGGGCSGKPNISFGKADGSLIFFTEGSGAYSPCSSLMLTTQRILYMKCPAEFGSQIRKINLLDMSTSVVLSCGFVSLDEGKENPVSCE